VAEFASTPHRFVRWAPALVVTVVLTATLIAAFALRSPAQPPQPLGAFDLPDLHAPNDPTLRYSNASLLGKPAVITVFDSSCVPCKAELPMISDVAEGVGDRVTVLGVDHLDRPAAANEFVATLRLSFPIAHELTGDLSQSWEVGGLPTTLFVDSRGREVGRVLGVIARDDLLNRIKRLS
jgi:thiol-disulfide isomerase/thioredoxin